MITEQQKERRKRGIFASDVPRIMRGDTVRLVLEKLGELQPEDEIDYDDNIEVQVGNEIEDRILDAYQAERPTIEMVRDPNQLEYFHPNFSWLGSHPDSHDVPKTLVVEAKSVGDYNRHDFGDGADEVPDRIVWQTQTQMACIGAKRAEIPVCFLNVPALKMLVLGKMPPITIFEVHADEELEDMLIRESEYIWGCIQNREIPAPKTIEDVRLLYKRDTGEVIQADDQLLQLYKDLVLAADLKKAAEANVDELKVAIQMIMKDASEVRHYGQTLTTWNKSKDREYFDKKRFKLEHPDLYKQFCREQLGPRVFLTKKLKGQI